MKSRVTRGKVRISFLLSFAFAHQPYRNESSTLEQPFNIENVTVSKALFGNVEVGETDYFKLEVSEGFNLDLTLFVGDSCSKDFSPEVWSLGPGLNGDSEGNDIRFQFPPGYDAIFVGEGGWKPFSGHGLVGREGPSIREPLKAGIYYIVVEAIENSLDGGFYLLSLSGSESFGGGEGGLEVIPRFNACG
jgi:hypothetical protein